jgi:hypothetical protein
MSAKASFAGQLSLGLLMVALGILGQLRAHDALLQHTVVWRRRLANASWMDPWQATVAYGFILVLGVFLVVHAIQKSRR